ncbi:hypothetical protein BSKO_01552 [Bryopsis sp. KO-2023]|nr:hypothetical protein BSKO_01552 [Bryopsis sp. KO-2023]
MEKMSQVGSFGGPVCEIESPRSPVVRPHRKATRLPSYEYLDSEELGLCEIGYGKSGAWSGFVDEMGDGVGRRERCVKDSARDRSPRVRRIRVSRSVEPSSPKPKGKPMHARSTSPAALPSGMIYGIYDNALFSKQDNLDCGGESSSECESPGASARGLLDELPRSPYPREEGHLVPRTGKRNPLCPFPRRSMSPSPCPSEGGRSPSPFERENSETPRRPSPFDREHSTTPTPRRRSPFDRESATPPRRLSPFDRDGSMSPPAGVDRDSANYCFGNEVIEGSLRRASGSGRMGFWKDLEREASPSMGAPGSLAPSDVKSNLDVGAFLAMTASANGLKLSELIGGVNYETKVGNDVGSLQGGKGDGEGSGVVGKESSGPKYLSAGTEMGQAAIVTGLMRTRVLVPGWSPECR